MAAREEEAESAGLAFINQALKDTRLNVHRLFHNNKSDNSHAIFAKAVLPFSFWTCVCLSCCMFTWVCKCVLVTLILCVII